MVRRALRKLRRVRRRVSRDRNAHQAARMIDASEISFGLGSDAGRMAAAILFLQSSMEAMDVYSALNSSPWTAESFGSDPRKRQACLEYVYHGVGVTAFYCIGAAVLANNWWPII